MDRGISEARRQAAQVSEREKPRRRTEVERPQSEVRALKEQTTLGSEVERYLERYLFQMRERFGLWDKNDARQKLIEGILERLYGQMQIPRGQLIGTNAPEINAFVMRGKTEVHVHGGLLRALQEWCERHGETLTEDKLAMVIAHELTHVEQGTEEITGQGEEAEELRKRKKRQEVKNSEYDADRRGLAIMAQAGYNPREGIAAISFIRSLGEGLPFFSTHPRSVDRVRELVELVESPDTFLPNINKNPTAVSAEVLAAIGQDPPGRPGTALYRREGLERLPELMAATTNVHDAMEVALMARGHDLNALASQEHAKNYLKRARAQRIVLHNFSRVVDTLASSHFGGDYDEPDRRGRYVMQEFAYSTPTPAEEAPKPPAAVSHLEEYIKAKVKEFKQNIEKTLDQLDGAIATLEQALLNIDRGEWHSGSAEVGYQTKEAIAQQYQSKRDVREKLVLIYSRVQEAIVQVTPQTLTQLAEQAEIIGDRSKFWQYQEEAKRLVQQLDGGALLEWCATNGTAFFTDIARSDKEGLEQRSGGVVSFESSYESVLPHEYTMKEDIFTSGGRQLFLTRSSFVMVRKMLEERMGDMIEKAGEEFMRGERISSLSTNPRPAPRIEHLLGPLSERFAALYRGALSADHAQVLARFVADHSVNLENVGYRPEELDELVVVLSKEECAQVLEKLVRPAVTLSPSGSQLLLHESGLKAVSNQGEILYGLWEQEFFRKVAKRVEQEQLPRPAPEVRLAAILNAVKHGEGSETILYKLEFIKALQELNIKSADGLTQYVQPLLNAIKDRYARQELFEAVAEACTQVPPTEMLRFHKGEDIDAVWKYFKGIWDTARRQEMSPQEQLVFLEALFEVLPQWDAKTGGKSHDAKREDRAWTYNVGLSAEYVRRYEEVHPGASLVDPLKRIAKDGFFAYATKERDPAKRGTFLGDAGIDQRLQSLSGTECIELAHYLTQIEGTQKSVDLGGFFSRERPDQQIIRNICARAVCAYNGTTDTDVPFNPQGRVIQDNLTFLREHVPTAYRDDLLYYCFKAYRMETRQLVEDQTIAPGGALLRLQPIREHASYLRKRLEDLLPKGMLEQVAAAYDPRARSFTALLEGSPYMSSRRKYLEEYFEETRLLTDRTFSPAERAQKVLVCIPERTDFRDECFVKIEADAIDGRGLVIKGHALASQIGQPLTRTDVASIYEFYRIAIPGMVGSAQQQLWSRRADQLYQDVLAKGEDTSFSKELERLKALYPHASFVRDEALLRLGDSARVQTPEQAQAILELLFEAQRRTAEEHELDQQSHLEIISTIAGRLSRTERSELLLWIMDAQKSPPLFLRALGGQNQVSVEEIPGLIFGATTQEREKFFIRLLYGENGTLDPRTTADEKLTGEFLEAGFARLFPKDDQELTQSAREILRTIFMTVMQEHDSFRRSKIFIAMLEALRGAGEASTGERMRALLETLGPVFIKAGQVLSEEEREPGMPLLPESIQQELRALKQSARTFHRTAALGVLGAAGEFTKSPDNARPLVSVEQQLGAASIKQVYLARQADGGLVVEKVRRPSIGKHLEEDLRVLVKVIDELRRTTSVPEGLAERIGRWIRDEANFAHETENHEAVSAAVRKYAKARQVTLFPVRIPRLLRHGPEHIREEYVRGLSLGELRDIAAGRQTWDDATARHGLTAKERRGYAELLDRLADLHLQALDALLYQMFKEGRFHSDPHAGNIVVTPAGEVVFIDLGSAGKVEAARIPELRKFFGGFISQSGELVRDSVRAFVSDLDDAQLARIMDTIQTPGLDNRDKFQRILVLISEGGRAIDEGFEKFLKALATGAYLGRELPPERVAPSIFAYTNS